MAMALPSAVCVEHWLEAAVELRGGFSSKKSTHCFTYIWYHRCLKFSSPDIHCPQ